MNRSATTLGFLLCCMTLGGLNKAHAGTADGRYHAQIDGVASSIELSGADDAIQGRLQEGNLVLNLAGRLNGGELLLQLTEPTLGLPLGTLSGRLQGGVFAARIEIVSLVGGGTQVKTASYVREGVRATPNAAPNAGPAPAVTPGGGARDPALVGTWVHDEVINSSGGVGAASFSTRRTMVLSNDGRVEQWVESAGGGGGGDWSYGGGRQTEFSGQWQTRDGALWLRQDGQSEFSPGAHYRFSGQYLVLEGGGRKLILQRR